MTDGSNSPTEYFYLGARLVAKESQVQTSEDTPGYTGHLEDDDLQLTYMQQRYYDPLLGRFYSNDPVWFTPQKPMLFNRYAYANNNPYKYTDPDGRVAIPLMPPPIVPPVTPNIPGQPSLPNHTGGSSPSLPQIPVRDISITGMVVSVIQAAINAGSDNSTEQKGQSQAEVGECPSCGGKTTDRESKIAKDHGISRGEVKDRIHDIKGGRLSGNPNVEVCSGCGEVFPQSENGILGDSIGNIKDEIDLYRK